jgi:hypothetical protein
MIIGDSPKIKDKEIDIRDYAKYVLMEGINIEKRELLSCLKSKIILQNNQIYLIPEDPELVISK